MQANHFSRRKFIRLSGIGALGLAAPDQLKHLSFPAPARLSVQLYTVRDQIKNDLKGTLKRIADIGFRNVETAFWPKEISLAQAAEALKEAGLSVSSAHIELPEHAQLRTFLDTAKAFNTKKMIWHGWPEDNRYGSLQGTRELISIYNNVNQFAKDNGLEFGLHNHWWEYRNKLGGSYVFEVLNEELEKDIFFELDTYWVKVAGHDPAEIVAKLGSRVKLMHIKDGPAKWNDNLAEDNPDPMTPVGKGTQDFPSIIKAAKNNTEWLVIEMDKTAIDVFDALKQSFDYMVGNKLAIA
ncbi:MAG TPA: sugar phosphate isomerase/epimerase [Chitinophagaceae bacterium]|nr:sugar phosphate isomerase/epimerase [Chitinophagaceae bacterium]